MTYEKLTSRNWLFISPENQKKLKNTKILIAGTGLGSVISELLVRSGCENITICDGDIVEYSNLNRQNFYTDHVGSNKADSLKKILLKINPKANIESLPFFFDETNIKNFIQQSDIVINTIDFDCDAFIECSKVCKALNKYEIFPINLGFGAAVTVHKKSTIFTDLFKQEGLKLKIINHIIKSKKTNKIYNDFLNYQKVTNPQYDPQLCISSYIAASLVLSIIFKIIDQKDVDLFPKFYHKDFLNNI